MSASVRLGAAAAALVAVFATALLAGGAFGPDRDGVAAAETTSPHGAEAPHGAAAEQPAGAHSEDANEHGEMAAQPVRGLASSQDGLSLELDRRSAPRGRPFDLAFRVVGSDGQAVTDFDVSHAKRMHVIVVRRDLTGFQHVHPTLRADGVWSVPVTLSRPGSYRVFADFSTDETAKTLAADLQVDGPVTTRPLPAPATTVDADGLRVARDGGTARAGQEAELDFSVTRDGSPVQVQDYLGAKGHLVALREGDLAFLHVHPDADRLSFMAQFPSAGRYRLFLQSQVDGRVHTAAFTQEVSR